MFDESIKERKFGSVKLLAKKYDTTPSQLLKWYYASCPATSKHMNSDLSQAEEEQFLYAATALSLSNLDWSVQDVIKAVKDVWYQNFADMVIWLFGLA